MGADIAAYLDATIATGAAGRPTTGDLRPQHPAQARTVAPRLQEDNASRDARSRVRAHENLHHYATVAYGDSRPDFQWRWSCSACGYWRLYASHEEMAAVAALSVHPSYHDCPARDPRIRGISEPEDNYVPLVDLYCPEPEIEVVSDSECEDEPKSSGHPDMTEREAAQPLTYPMPPSQGYAGFSPKCNKCGHLLKMPEATLNRHVVTCTC